MEALVLLADGFEEIEAISIIDVLRRAEIQTITASIHDRREVEGGHGIRVIADTLLADIDENPEIILLPGGGQGVENLSRDPRVIDFLKQKKSKLVGAICAAPSILAQAEIVYDKKVTSYPTWKDKVAPKAKEYVEDRVVMDGDVITSRGPGTALEFAFTIVERLRSKEKADTLRQQMLV